MALYQEIVNWKIFILCMVQKDREGKKEVSWLSTEQFIWKMVRIVKVLV